jgi:hypothetical protein
VSGFRKRSGLGWLTASPTHPRIPMHCDRRPIDKILPAKSGFCQNAWFLRRAYRTSARYRCRPTRLPRSLAQSGIRQPARNVAHALQQRAHASLRMPSITCAGPPVNSASAFGAHRPAGRSYSHQYVRLCPQIRPAADRFLQDARRAVVELLRPRAVGAQRRPFRGWSARTSARLAIAS